MEEIRKQAISIFDLGVQANEMLMKWHELKEYKISLKEFPNVDFTQKINGKTLMEIILEFVLCTEENKRLIAKQKQAEGIAKAREKGIKLGRREKSIPHNFIDVYESVIAKQMTVKKATEILDVDYKTYRKWVKQYKS